MPSEDIARFIELANFPLDMPLQHPSLIFDSLVRRQTKGNIRNREVWTRECADISARLPETARKFLGRPEDVPVFIENYETLFHVRELIPPIARAPKTSSSGFEQFKRNRRISRGHHVAVLCQTSVELVLQEDGAIRLARNKVLEALEDVNTDRIRPC
ncbi:MAG TPA: hypothetical protein VG297_24275, partial [Bryobacteraceae bacterium]|nr:hypothetical protein [Bryobacteraceae bacterium]